VAAASVLVYGSLSLVAVAVLYWVDLFFLTLRAMTQQLISRPIVPRQSTLFLPPFRLLTHKRGAVTLTDRLPPVYLRNLPRVVGGVFIVVLSAVTTTYVAAVGVPSEFWTDPATPFVLVGGLVAAATKSWLVLAEHVASGAHESEPADAVAPRKRMLLFAVYALLLLLVSEWVAGVLAGDGAETARAGVTFVASVLIVFRFAYGVRASRTRVGDVDSESEREETTTDSDGGVAAWFRSALSGEQDVVVPSPPSVPDRRPLETATPNRRSVLAAGFVNAVTTGGVVDKQFGHWRQFLIRIGMVGLMPVAILALVDGAVVVSVALTGVLLCLVGVFSAASAVHMLLALGSVEYRFYESEVVSYDRYLGEPQWSVPYDSIRDVSVERGLFGSPLWLDAGTVFFQRTHSPDGDGVEQREARSSLAFVSDPERVGETIESRGGQRREMSSRSRDRP
jgi:hypothetical protein